jgi:hypothetical protein
MTRAGYLDRVKAIWTAQMIGQMTGLLFEHKTASVLNQVSLVMAKGFAVPDDDYYYEMVAIRTFEKYGIHPTVEQLGADGWNMPSPRYPSMPGPAPVAPGAFQVLLDKLINATAKRTWGHQEIDLSKYRDQTVVLRLYDLILVPGHHAGNACWKNLRLK